MGSFRELSGSSGCGFNGLGPGDGFVSRIFLQLVTEGFEAIELLAGAAMMRLKPAPSP
jgi:hypothetical protein